MPHSTPTVSIPNPHHTTLREQPTTHGGTVEGRDRRRRLHLTTTLTTASTLTLLGALTGCTAQPDDPSATSIPTPIEVIAPESREDCTTTLETDGSAADPNRVTVRCADTTTLLEGTFRDSYINMYDPDAAHDVEKVIVVGGEVRAWVRMGDTTCLILHKPGNPPTECKPTETQRTEPLDAPEPTRPPA